MVDIAAVVDCTQPQIWAFLELTFRVIADNAYFSFANNSEASYQPILGFLLYAGSQMMEPGKSFRHRKFAIWIFEIFHIRVSTRLH